jgi:sulfite exporter TauE/SafE
MLSSIHPLGERSRNNSWALTTVAHVAGSLVGGALVGVAAGTVGWLLTAAVGSTIVLVGAVVAAFVGAAADLGLGGLTLPSIRRQVNERWIGEYRGWVYGAGFGVQLGAGYTTIVTSGVVYLLVPVAALTGSVVGGAIVGGAFGLFRGAMLLLMVGANTPQILTERHRRFVDLAPPARWGAVATQAAVGAGLALAMLFGATGGLA